MAAKEVISLLDSSDECDSIASTESLVYDCPRKQGSLVQRKCTARSARGRSAVGGSSAQPQPPASSPSPLSLESDVEVLTVCRAGGACSRRQPTPSPPLRRPKRLRDVLRSNKRNRNQRSTPLPKKRSKFVKCPACGKQVVDLLINMHLDSCCARPPQKRTKLTPSQASKQHPLIAAARAQAALKPEALMWTVGSTYTEPRAWWWQLHPVPPTATSQCPGCLATSDLLSVARRMAGHGVLWCSDHASSVPPVEAVSWGRVEVKALTPSGRAFLTLHEAPTGQAACEAAALQRLCGPVRFLLSPSLLKSLVQKNVRQGRPQGAVRAAVQLLRRAGFMELVRRVAVIVVEDAVLHPLFPLLLWLTGAASKTLKPTPAHINAVLAVVQDVAAVRFKDELPCPNALRPSKEIWREAEELPAQARALVQALLVRSCFGGLHCDVQLLQRAAQVWQERFSSGPSPPPLDGVQHEDWLTLLEAVYSKTRAEAKLTPVNVWCVKAVEADDLLLAAVDMHCSSLMDALMQAPGSRAVIARHLPAADDARRAQLVAAAVWEFRSRRSTKALLPGQQTTCSLEQGKVKKLQAMFKELEECIDEFAFQHLQRRAAR